MKVSFLILLFSFLSVLLNKESTFLIEQKRFERVRTAINEKQSLLEKVLLKHDLTKDNFNLLIVAYKDQDLLELFAKSKGSSIYKKIESYEICSRSGKLGPKRKMGDYQVPEGFYHIDRFNPTSSYYLSLGLNYPNASDKKKSKASNLGGDIFIHGSCVTIGCLPMTDEKIKEIYLYSIYAKSNGQDKIPVYVFPFKMTDENMVLYRKKYSDDTALLGFWSNLKTGYDKFVNDHKALTFSVLKNGDYQF